MFKLSGRHWTQFLLHRIIDIRRTMMETIIILFVIWVALDIAAWKWGFDSSDGIKKGERQLP